MIFAGSKKKDTRISILIALLLNVAVLILCFFFLRWKVQDPPPEDMTVELTMADFGYSNTGANSTDGSTAQTQQPVVEEAPPEEAIVDNTSDTSAPVQETPSNTTQPTQTQSQTQNQAQEPTPETQEPEQQVSNTLNNAFDAIGGGDGGGAESGDVGTQNGKIDGKGVFGDGSGWNLSGRNMTGKPKFNGTPKKNGKVQVRITVGKDGKVRTAKVVHSAPTNTSDQSLFNLALAAAKTAKFNTDQSAKINQSGTITFVFKVN